ncbi:hypothetical protein F4780DRAFT_115097 [Xylariomycetidae sp. FL0641]|nr:hypothetical protein F4780DRAFT_115097 [Xylariomycetidae sp. FL0641]
MNNFKLLPLLAAAATFSFTAGASPSPFVGDWEIGGSNIRQIATISTTKSERPEIVTSIRSAVAAATTTTTSPTPDLGSNINSRADDIFAGVTPPPQCAIICQMEVGTSGPCSPADVECMCSQKNKTPDPKLMTCIMSRCTVMEALQAERFTSEICHAPVTNKGPTVLGWVWGLESFGILGVMLRLLSRWLVAERNFWWDDLVIVLTLLSNVTAGGFITVSVHYGYGQDLWMLSHEQITNSFKYLISVTPSYIFSTGALKISLVLFYLRVFDAQSGNRYFRILCWVMMAIITIYTVVHIFTAVFTCAPISYMWTSWDGEHVGTCGDRTTDGMSHAITNVAVDVILFFMPIPCLWRLNMSWTKKAAVTCMFAFGLLTATCSVARVIEMANEDLGSRSNATVDTVGFMIWTIAECKAGLLCACVPMALQCIRLVCQRAGSSLRSHSTAPGSGRSGSASDPESGAGGKGDRGSGMRRVRTRNPHSMALSAIDAWGDTDEEDGESTAGLRFSFASGSDDNLRLSDKGNIVVHTAIKAISAKEAEEERFYHGDGVDAETLRSARWLRHHISAGGDGDGDGDGDGYGASKRDTATSAASASASASAIGLALSSAAEPPPTSPTPSSVFTGRLDSLSAPDSYPSGGLTAVPQSHLSKSRRLSSRLRMPGQAL